jgi:hypothetical protein
MASYYAVSFLKKMGILLPVTRRKKSKNLVTFSAPLLYFLSSALTGNSFLKAVRYRGFSFMPL